MIFYGFRILTMKFFTTLESKLWFSLLWNPFHKIFNSFAWEWSFQNLLFFTQKERAILNLFVCLFDFQVMTCSQCELLRGNCFGQLELSQSSIRSWFPLCPARTILRKSSMGSQSEAMSLLACFDIWNRIHPFTLTSCPHSKVHCT